MITMKLMKRLTSILVSGALLLGMSSFSTFAAETDVPQADPKPPVSVDMERSGFVQEGGYFDVYLTVNDTASVNVQAEISTAILEVLNAYALENGEDSYPVLPGDSNQIRVTLENQSEHTFTYERGSFVMSAYYEEEEALSPFIGFDGKQIPYSCIASIPSSHKAIYQGLFGLSSSGDVTADMMFGIYDTLAAKGYTGETALTDYFLDYYSDLYGKDYASWDELAADKPNLGDTFAQTGSNSIFTMSYGKMKVYCEEHPELAPYVYYESGIMGSVGLGDDDEVRVQIKWPEQDLAAFSYDVFYNDFFSVAYGEECEQLEPNRNTAFTRTRGIGDYTDVSGALYQQTDAYFAGLENADVLAPGESLTFDCKLAIDGPGVGNGYMNYSFSYYNAIAFDQIDTSWSVVHQYYTSTDGGEYVLDGTVTSDAVSGLVGDVIQAASVNKLTTYNGNEYAFYGDSGDIQLVLDAASNQIVLEYRREVKTPSESGDSSSSESDNSSSSSSSSKPEPSETEKPDGNPQTGDTLPFIMGAVLLTISGAACWLVLRKRVRG